MHADCDAQDLADVANLICQLILRYKEALRGLLAGAVPVFVAAVHALLPADWDWAGRNGQPQTAASGALSILVCACCLLTGAVKWLCPSQGRWAADVSVLAQWQSAHPNVTIQPLRLSRQPRLASGLLLLLHGQRSICSAS